MTVQVQVRTEEMATKRSRRWLDPEAERRWTRSFTRLQRQLPNPPIREEQPDSPSSAAHDVPSEPPQPMNLQATDPQPMIDFTQAPSSGIQYHAQSSPPEMTPTDDGNIIYQSKSEY